jgi:phosphatidylinositol alpha-mannosyltransferase
MGAPEKPPAARKRTRHRRTGLIVAAILLAGLLAFALSRLGLHRIGHALITASPGWVALAFVLMACSLVLRSVSWHEVLRAALPETPISWMAVTRATMIGVMGSAVVPGRIGEPTRVVVLTRRLEGPNRRLLPVVAGTVFSQTLINLLALGVLLAVTFSSVRIFHGNVAGIEAALAVPLAIFALVIVGPRLLALARRSRSMRVSGAADAITRLLQLARRGLIVFARPRYGLAAVSAQLLAWALQWLACYAVIRALSAGPRRPHRSGGDPARGQPQRDPPRDALERRRLPGGLPGRAGRLWRRGGPRAGLRNHPAGGRGRHGAGARSARPAAGGPQLAGHPAETFSRRGRAVTGAANGSS